MTSALRAASHAEQRPPHARLLWVRADGAVVHREREHLADLLRAGDLVVANDAATLPASLHGTHEPSCNTSPASHRPSKRARDTARRTAAGCRAPHLRSTRCRRRA